MKIPNQPLSVLCIDTLTYFKARVDRGILIPVLIGRQFSVSTAHIIAEYYGA